MGWNYRIMAVEHKGEVYLRVHEVHYDKKGVPNSYTLEPTTLGGEDLEDIKGALELFKLAFEKPVLWYGDRFPEEYEV